MNSVWKRVIVVLAILCFAIVPFALLAGCTSDAEVVSENISKVVFNPSTIVPDIEAR